MRALLRRRAAQSGQPATSSLCAWAAGSERRPQASQFAGCAALVSTGDHAFGVDRHEPMPFQPCELLIRHIVPGKKEPGRDESAH